MNINMYNQIIATIKNNQNVNFLFYTKIEKKITAKKEKVPTRPIPPVQPPIGNFNPNQIQMVDTIVEDEIDFYNDKDFCLHSKFVNENGILRLESEIKNNKCELCGKELKGNEVNLIESFLEALNVDFYLQQINIHRQLQADSLYDDLLKRNLESKKKYEQAKKDVNIEDLSNRHNEKEINNNQEQEEYDTPAPELKPKEIKKLNANIISNERKEMAINEEKQNNKIFENILKEENKLEKEKIVNNKKERGRYNRISDRTIRGCLKDYFNGENKRNIAKEYGIAYSTLDIKIRDCKNDKYPIFSKYNLIYSDIQNILNIMYRIFKEGKGRDQLINDIDNNRLKIETLRINGIENVESVKHLDKDVLSDVCRISLIKMVEIYKADLKSLENKEMFINKVLSSFINIK